MTERSKRSILLVGRDPVLVETAATAFTEFEVLTCQSATEALHAFDRLNFDLAVIDADPDGMSGYDLCRRIRGTRATDPMLVLLVDANDPTARLAAYDAGADDCLQKPFSAAELIAKCRVLARLVTEEQLGRLKTQLLDMIAHELRTPLTGILLGAESLASAPDVEAVRTWSDVILEGARRLELLADKGLLLCQLRSGALEHEPETFDLVPELEDIVRERAPTAATEGIELHVTGCEAADVFVDRHSAGVLLRFLVDIALRACRPNSSVLLATATDQRGVHLTMTASARQLLPDRPFEEFVPRFADGQFVGADMGLALARDLMHALDGSLELASSRTDEISLTCHFPTDRAERRGTTRRRSRAIGELEILGPLPARAVDASSRGCLATVAPRFPVRVRFGEDTPPIDGRIVRTQMIDGRIGFGIAFDDEPKARND